MVRRLLLLLAWCSCGGDELELESREQAIVNGQITTAHPTAVPLYTGGQFACSATLIGKQTLLTAGHCVTPGKSYQAVVGGATIPVSSAVVHPSYDAKTLTADVAVMRLASSAPIAPMAIATRPPAVGLPIVLVGYGCTAEGDTSYGTKRVAKNAIKTVLADQFMFTGSTGAIGGHCYGDSGGPTYAMIEGKEAQVGVHSWGPAPCGGDNYDARVDVYASWIAQQAGGDVVLEAADSIAPSVTILEPSPGATVPAAFTVRLQITDNVKVAAAELLVDGASRGIASNTGIAQTLDLVLAAGEHTLRVVASDPAGNTGERSITVRVATGSGQPAPGPQPPTPSPTPAQPEMSSVPGGTYVGGCQVVAAPAVGDLFGPWLVAMIAIAIGRRRLL